MKGAADELREKLQRQRLRSEGGSGAGDEKRAASAPGVQRGSLVVAKASAGWHAFAQRPPRSTSATSGPSQSSNRTEIRDLDEQTKAGNLNTPTRSKRAGSDLEFSPRTSLRGLTSGRVGGPVRSGTKQASAVSSNQNCELKKRGSGDTKEKELSAKLAVAEAKNEELQRQLDSTKHQRDEDMNSLEARLKAAEMKIAEQEKELEDHKRNVVSLSKSNAELTTESARLEEKLDLAQKASSAVIQPSGGSSESALRAVMTKPGASVDELRNAIKAVEALVNEAQRELERGEYRQKRAAYEKLHEVLGKADEEQLLAALVEARRVGLNKEDIEKAEERLQELGSMTDDARHAKEVEKLKAALKPKLFLLVKKNDASGLEEELGNLSADIAWEEWRDHNGRTLVKYAQGLRFPLVLEVLQEFLASRKPGAITTDAPKVISPYQVEEARTKASSGDSCSRVDHWTPSSKAGVTTPETRTPSSGQASPNVPSTPPNTSPKRSVPEKQLPTTMYSARSPTSPSGYSGPYAEQKKAAFRAVSLADETGLRAALENTPPEEWSKWRNPGGQELLEMSKERDESRGTSIHALLLQIQGVVVERKYESLEEGQAVWVFFHGEVVPRQATVREDTSADADKVLVEYWDGNEPATYVDRCVVNRLGYS